MGSEQDALIGCDPRIVQLVAEHEQLKRENARLREIAQTLVDGFTLFYGDRAYECALCGSELPEPPVVDLFGDWTKIGWRERHIQHTSDCPVTKARAILTDKV